MSYVAEAKIMYSYAAIHLFLYLFYSFKSPSFISAELLFVDL